MSRFFAWLFGTTTSNQPHPPASAAKTVKRSVSSDALRKALDQTKRQYGQAIKDLADL